MIATKLLVIFTLAYMSVYKSTKRLKALIENWKNKQRQSSTSGQVDRSEEAIFGQVTTLIHSYKTKTRMTMIIMIE